MRVPAQARERAGAACGRPAVLAAVGLAVAAAVLALALDDRGGPVDSGSIVLIGDSLNVGVEPYLRDLLEHWRIRSDDVVGRPSSEGLAALAAVHGATGPIVVSLGTNDDPGDPEAFRARGRAAARPDRPDEVRDLGDALARRRPGDAAQRRPRRDRPHAGERPAARVGVDAGAPSGVGRTRCHARLARRLPGAGRGGRPAHACLPGGGSAGAAR